MQVFVNFFLAVLMLGKWEYVVNARLGRVGKIKTDG